MLDPQKSEKILEKTTFGNPQTAIRGLVGRPRKPPSIKYISQTRRWRVLATVGRKQVKKIVRTQDEANHIASQLTNSQHADFQSLSTRLSPVEILEAEAAKTILADLGLGFLDGAKWLMANYVKQDDILWKDAITIYTTSREKLGLSKFQVGHVSRDARRLAAFTGREKIGTLTRAEVEAFFAKNTEDAKPATFNNLLGNIRTFARWAKNKKYLATDPTEGIERRKVKHSLPAVLTPAQATALIRDIEANAPKWLPYVTCCLFAAVRPCMREGEAGRLDAALRAGKTVIHPDGLEIEGKAHGVRIIPWTMTGPLKTWIKTFRPSPGLWPSTTANAERDWAKIRRRHNLTADILRHTGISAMVGAPNASFTDIARAAGNSERMIRRHYLGRWTRSDTEALWGILPLSSPAASTPSNICQIPKTEASPAAKNEPANTQNSKTALANGFATAQSR